MKSPSEIEYVFKKTISNKQLCFSKKTNTIEVLQTWPAETDTASVTFQNSATKEFFISTKVESIKANEDTSENKSMQVQSFSYYKLSF